MPSNEMQIGKTQKIKVTHLASSGAIYGGSVDSGLAGGHAAMVLVLEAFDI